MRRILDQQRILSLDEYSALENVQGPRVFQRIETVIYRGHIPHVCLVLKDGRMLMKKGPCELLVPIRCLVGLEELSTKSPIGFDLVVTPGTTAFILDNSTLSELLQMGVELVS